MHVHSSACMKDSSPQRKCHRQSFHIEDWALEAVALLKWTCGGSDLRWGNCLILRQIIGISCSVNTDWHMPVRVLDRNFFSVLPGDAKDSTWDLLLFYWKRRLWYKWIHIRGVLRVGLGVARAMGAGVQRGAAAQRNLHGFLVCPISQSINQ